MTSRRIGSLWIRESNGKKFLSGVLQDISGDIQIAVFENDRKEKENQPDYNIVLSEKREGQTQKRRSTEGFLDKDQGRDDSGFERANSEAQSAHANDDIDPGDIHF